MPFKALLLFGWLFFHSIFLQAQNLTTVEGVIVDEENRTLPNVSLRIGSNLMTLTNNEGGFSLKYPDQYIKDSITISSIGYKTIKIPLLKLRNPLKIKLDPDINQLMEVVISANNGAAILKKALQNISLNYPSESFEMVGLYREIGKIDEDYLSFAEASMNILNQGYQNVKEKDLILINNQRNLKKVGEQTVENPFNSAVKGVPYVVLNNDLVKNPGAIFGKDYLSKYSYQITGTTKVNDEDAYIITFDQQESTKQALYKGTVVIIKSSFAIASVDLALSPNGRQYAKPDIPVLQRPLMSLMGYHFQKKNEELSLRYAKIDGKWYPYFYKIATTHHVEARKKNIDGSLIISAELFISKINKLPSKQYTKALVMPHDHSFQKN